MNTSTSQPAEEGGGASAHFGRRRWRELPEAYRKRFESGNLWVPDRVLSLARKPKPEELAAIGGSDWTSPESDPYVLPADASLLNAGMRLLLLVPLSVLLIAMSVGTFRAESPGVSDRLFQIIFVGALLLVSVLGWRSFALRLFEWRDRARGRIHYGLVLAGDFVWRDFPSWFGSASCHYIPKKQIDSVTRQVDRSSSRSPHVYVSVAFRDYDGDRRELRLHETDFDGSAGRSEQGLLRLVSTWSKGNAPD